MYIYLYRTETNLLWRVSSPQGWTVRRSARQSRNSGDHINQRKIIAMRGPRTCWREKREGGRRDGPVDRTNDCAWSAVASSSDSCAPAPPQGACIHYSISVGSTTHRFHPVIAWRVADSCVSPRVCHVTGLMALRLLDLCLVRFRWNSSRFWTVRFYHRWKWTRPFEFWTLATF